MSALLTLPLGAATGGVLYCALALDRPRLGRARPQRTLRLVARAAYEELAWRWLLVGIVLAPLSAGAAIAISAALFAVAHVPGQGWRAGVHLVTGGAFGVLFLMLGLTAAIAAHAAYNLLVSLALEARP